MVVPLDYRLTEKGAIALLTTFGDEQHRDFEPASSPTRRQVAERRRLDPAYGERWIEQSRAINAVYGGIVKGPDVEDTLVPRNECGHLHFRSASRIFEACPPEGCWCPFDDLGNGEDSGHSVQQPPPPRRFIGRTVIFTGPITGWRPGARLLAELPVDLYSGGEWKRLDNEFTDYRDAEAAIRRWWEPLVGDAPVAGQKVMDLVEGSKDYGLFLGRRQP